MDQKVDYYATDVSVNSETALITSVSTSSLCHYLTLLQWSPPRNLNLERLVRTEFLDRENYMFHFLINMMTCFW
ncbi:hypothetical protein CFP56_006782 [Quercus suber]|uniref:Uncharacterized protein n=1 Tax=Quercus suber TaxID=58331 RepID=A0AAW0LAK4_QUESU